MPYADPQENERRIRQLWQERGRQYRANRTPPPPPLSRQQALDEDVAQAEALAELEGRRIGRRRAGARFKAWIAAERRWIRLTSSVFRIEEEPRDG